MLAFGVLAKDIDLDIEQAAGRQWAQAGGGVGVGDDGYLYLVAEDGGDGEADAFDGDGALGDDVAGIILAASSARSFAINLALEIRGRREDRVRAAPAVSCAIVAKECCARAYRFGGSLRPSLRNGFTAYT